MHTFGSQGAGEGDDLQLTPQQRGLTLSRTLESSLSQIAHHAQHNPPLVLATGELGKRGVQIIAGGKVQRLRSQRELHQN